MRLSDGNRYRLVTSQSDWPTYHGDPSGNRYLPIRMQLLLSGRMPKGGPLPFEWYETPNIHLFTLTDFLALCRADGIVVKDVCTLPGGPCSRAMLACGLRNSGAERVIVRIARGKENATGRAS